MPLTEGAFRLDGPDAAWLLGRLTPENRMKALVLIDLPMGVLTELTDGEWPMGDEQAQRVREAVFGVVAPGR